MKNIFSPHVREVHITQTRTLRLRVSGIHQAISVLSLIAQGLNEVGPKTPIVTLEPAIFKSGGVESIEICFVQKEKAHHKDVYIIKLFPERLHGTTVIINEDDFDYVGKRLKHLVRRFKQEREKGIFKPTRATAYPAGVGLTVSKMQSINQLAREPIDEVEVCLITAGKMNCGVTGQMLGRLRQLEKTEISNLDLVQSEAYVEKHKAILNKRKEDE